MDKIQIPICPRKTPTIIPPPIEGDKKGSAISGYIGRNLIKPHNRFPYNPRLNKYAKSMRKSMTLAEKTLWYGFLKDARPRFLRQRPIDNYIPDFYCSKARLVVEVDGDSHSIKHAEEYDMQRTRVLNEYGIQVIRFTNNEILNNLEKVVDEINRFLERFKVERV